MTDLSTPLLGLPLPAVWFALLFFLLGVFLLLDGFDFGVGVLFGLQDREDDRHALLSAIGPFWDGNEVWLVVFGGAMFAAFPPLYANLFSRHYLLMFAILASLGLRGLAPEFYERREDAQWQRWWGRAFTVGSTAAPFLLGWFVGNWLVGARTTLTLAGVLTGVVVLALSVVAGVAFLGLKLRDARRERLVAYGPRALVAYLASVVVLLAYLLVGTTLGGALLAAVPVALVALSVAAGAGYLLALRAERYLLAFGTVAVLVAALVSLVAVLLYPAVDPAASLTVGEAVVSPLPLNLMTLASALLLPLVFVYFAVLYSAFGGPIEAGETY